MSPLHIESFIDLAHLGLLQVSGIDAKKLLQGQLTCNLDEVTSAQSQLGAHCNPQGRILSFFRLFLYNENYYLQMPQEMISAAIAALQKYAMFFKVSLTDATSLLEKICCHQDAFSTLEDNFVKIKLPGTNDFYEIIGKPEHINAIKQKLSAQPNPENLWKLINIEAGIPDIYPNTAQKFLPHEINLQHLHAVSFEKGCYTGQEIIARMHYRGQLKKQMYRARVKKHSEILPHPGADIFNDQPCGMIVNSALEDTEHYQILVVTNTSDKENMQLFLDPAKIVPIEFLPLSLG